MKKVFLIAILSVAFVTAKAQFGLRAGMNFSTWHGDDVSGDDIKSILGPYVGASYNAKIGDHFSIQPELVFSSEGTQEQSGDTKIKVGYINLAPIVRFNTKSGFFLGTGPQFGFMVSAKEKDAGVSMDIKDQLNGFNFSWAFGAGFNFKGGFGVDARFNLGLTNIIDQSSASVKTGNFSLGVHYDLKAAKK